MAKAMSAPIEALRRQARLLLLLEAAEKAGLTPIGVAPLHAFAFLANVLAPVWQMPALDGKILKTRSGPFYPDLQQDLDRLVGLGMVEISDVGHILDLGSRWQLEARFFIRRDLAQPAVDLLSEEWGEPILPFLVELGYALSALDGIELKNALVEDATYCDPLTSVNNVLDFDEWSKRNPSASAAVYFDNFMPAGIRATPGEKLHLYVRHLRRRYSLG